MRAGELRHRVDILAPAVVEDDVGGQSTTWTLMGTVWASREDIGGREIFRGGGIAAEFSRRYVIRAPEFDLDATMRIRDPSTSRVNLDPDAEIGTLYDFARAPALIGARGKDGIEIFVKAVDQRGVLAA